MIVSLEAIFLSTFVMISQNRADAKRQVIADQKWQTVKEEDKQSEQLLELSDPRAHAGDPRVHEPPGKQRARAGKPIARLSSVRAGGRS
jgi:uncharacterized membrane protein